MTIGQNLAKTAANALELLAETEFSRDKILEACKAAAAKGYLSCQIRPSIPVDLSRVATLKTLREELQKERLDSLWIPYALPGEPPYKILELRWEARQSRSN